MYSGTEGYTSYIISVLHGMLTLTSGGCLFFSVITLTSSSPWTLTGLFSSGSLVSHNDLSERLTSRSFTSDCFSKYLLHMEMAFITWWSTGSLVGVTVACGNKACLHSVANFNTSNFSSFNSKKYLFTLNSVRISAFPCWPIYTVDIWPMPIKWP